MLLSYIHVCLCAIQSIHPSNECFCNNLIYLWCLLKGRLQLCSIFRACYSLLVVGVKGQYSVLWAFPIAGQRNLRRRLWHTSRRPDDKRPLASATSQNLTSLFVDQSSYVSMHSYHLRLLLSLASASTGTRRWPHWASRHSCSTVQTEAEPENPDGIHPGGSRSHQVEVAGVQLDSYDAAPPKKKGLRHAWAHVHTTRFHTTIQAVSQ